MIITFPVNTVCLLEVTAATQIPISKVSVMIARPTLQARNGEYKDNLGTLRLMIRTI